MTRIQSNHFITQPETKIKCLTAPGVGRNHTWMVSHRTIVNITIDHNITNVTSVVTTEAVGASSLASVDQTSYASPTLRSVEPSYVFTDDSPSALPGFGTRGGENVTLVGIDFGPLGTAISAFYRTGNIDQGSTPTLADSDIYATDCRVTVANKEVGRCVVDLQNGRMRKQTRVWLWCLPGDCPPCGSCVS